MISSKSSFKLPRGCLITAGILATLCAGCFGFSMLGALLGEPPASTVESIESTEIPATLPVTTVETLALPSPTLLIESTFTAFPTVTEAPPTITLTPTAVIIPVTGGSCIPDNPPQTGLVSQVVDGDTIRVIMDEDGLTYTVRYIGMDTPENTSQIEYFGPEATAKNTELVWGKPVTLIKDVSETDRFGRLLRYVLVEDMFVNYELVAQGYANTASFPPDIACIPTFQAAEQKASVSKLGLWGAPPTLAVVIPATSASGGASGNAPCNCGGPDLDCTTHFNTQAAAQACHNYCVSQGYGDVFRLDGNDNDGLACESLP